MIYAIIALILIVAALAFALHTQSQNNKQQAEEQQQLLTDYQRRVDEQQKLLEDYRALEKNFDNIGEGYEQALLAFDKMNEEQDKAKTANEALQKSLAALQQTNSRLQESVQKKAEAMAPIVASLQELAKTQGDNKLAAIVGRLTDLDDVQADLPPLERTDNVMVAQVADEAVKLTGIDQAQYIKFEQVVAPSAAVTMLLTCQPKAVRALTHVLDNALKFTTDGSVKLGVNVDMDKMLAVYTVEDTGTGVEAADAERVFEPYVKLNQYFDGQGIGLTVARNLARRLGGDLVLDTAFAGPGARFVLSLPI
ncbi:MAG: hypothetical protein II822_10380 [Prevotella sp.]|nr:hypothetical protein [Prevotella sp.]